MPEFDWLPERQKAYILVKYLKILSSKTIGGIKLILCIQYIDISLYINCVFVQI